MLAAGLFVLFWKCVKGERPGRVCHLVIGRTKNTHAYKNKRNSPFQPPDFFLFDGLFSIIYGCLLYVIRMADLIDATVDRIVKNGFDPIHSPFAHKVAVMLTTAQGIIDNGGFEYFFGAPFNIEPNTEDFVTVYETVGAIESAKAFELALSRSQTTNPTSEDLNQVLWAESENNYKHLEAYIEANPGLYV